MVFLERVSGTGFPENVTLDTQAGTDWGDRDRFGKPGDGWRTSNRRHSSSQSDSPQVLEEPAPPQAATPRIRTVLQGPDRSVPQQDESEDSGEGLGDFRDEVV